jgi:hypothetical protein
MELVVVVREHIGVPPLEGASIKSLRWSASIGEANKAHRGSDAREREREWELQVWKRRLKCGEGEGEVSWWCGVDCLNTPER